MDRVALPAKLARLLPGTVAEPVGGNTDGWEPERGKCHENAARWVALKPEFRAVHGWLYARGETFENRMRFYSHSIVADSNGRLFDVTLNASDPRYQFVVHPGESEPFLAAVAGNGMPYVEHILGPDPIFDLGSGALPGFPEGGRLF